MKVLMFGWEFPPHISGGLGTACHGLTQSLAEENIQILFVIPKADNHTTNDGVKIINASSIIIPLREDHYPPETQREAEAATKTSNVITIVVRSGLQPYNSPGVLSQQSSITQWNYQFSPGSLEKVKNETHVRYQFTGGYGPTLMDEVENYAKVAAEISRQSTFDIIHAHDWLTYPAGIAAKEISGKPLIVHVHATEIDRAGENGDPRVYQKEREGMEAADRIVAVSQWTKNIINSKYGIPAYKIAVVHNGIDPKEKMKGIIVPPIGKRIVTFLGRITHQKGPQYFIDAAVKVLRKFPDVHFVMAGSGDLLPKMIKRVARLRISSRFHFTGFLKGDQVDKIWTATNVYVMPSVSEPFGISPLEAARAGVPVIISKQSGVAEVMHHTIQIDFWDIEALASAICNLLQYESLAKTLIHNGEEEVREITWTKAATAINRIYHELTD